MNAWICDPETMAANALTDGYDYGDLCADIDRVLGDVLERTMRRYVGGDRAKEIRREKIEELADEVGLPVEE